MATAHLPGVVARIDLLGGLSPAQARVLAIVSGEPGCTIQRVAEHTGSAHATAKYHLAALVRLGLLAERRDGREVRHCLKDQEREKETYLRALLRDERKRSVALYLQRNPVHRMTVNQVAKALGVNYGFLKRTLAQLEEAGLVTLERRRHRFEIRLHPASPDPAFSPPHPHGLEGGPAAPRSPA